MIEGGITRDMGDLPKDGCEAHSRFVAFIDAAIIALGLGEVGELTLHIVC